MFEQLPQEMIEIIRSNVIATSDKRRRLLCKSTFMSLDKVKTIFSQMLELHCIEVTVDKYTTFKLRGPEFHYASGDIVSTSLYGLNIPQHKHLPFPCFRGQNGLGIHIHDIGGLLCGLRGIFSTYGFDALLKHLAKKELIVMF